jgi:hypothetical protein
MERFRGDGDDLGGDAANFSWRTYHFRDHLYLRSSFHFSIDQPNGNKTVSLRL